jgi:hypothetical protein
MEQNLVTERLNLIQEHRGVDCFMSHLLKGIDYPPANVVGQCARKWR